MAPHTLSPENPAVSPHTLTPIMAADGSCRQCGGRWAAQGSTTQRWSPHCSAARPVRVGGMRPGGARRHKRTASGAGRCVGRCQGRLRPVLNIPALTRAVGKLGGAVRSRQACAQRLSTLWEAGGERNEAKESVTESADQPGSRRRAAASCRLGGASCEGAGARGRHRASISLPVSPWALKQVS